MSKSSNKRKIKQLQRWMTETRSGKGYKRIKDKNGNYIKVKK